VDEIIFSFMEAVGRMSGNTTLLSTKSSTQLIAELEQLKKRYEKQILISYAFSKQASSNTTTTCPGGEKFFSIDSLGNGSPCTWISEHFPEFISNENIKNTSSTPTIHQQSIKKFRTFLNKMATLGFLGCPKEFLPEAKEVLWIDNYLHKISHTPLSAGRRF
jgi:MoaA/NifB/PqqE/SkfB family radical SAM enzyme